MAAILAMLVATVVAQGCSGKACSQDSDCSMGEACLYPIGSCSARGTCMTFPDPAGSGGCNASPVECSGGHPMCGCGVTVIGGCNYPEGYAGGPTNGDVDCPSPVGTEGPGSDGGVDASTSEEAGEAGLPEGSGEETVPPDGE
ncbi:MAG TPA: hypothetical protein VMI75_00315 [Polyangiaceae bacterium]|nr:hypothetical protein [Polyangiaceae bacterium]